MKNMKITGFGKYVPDNFVTNEELSKIVDTSDEWIYSKTGIKSRAYSVNEDTSDVCTKIALDVLKNSNVDPQEIELIIIATISADYSTPSVATMVAANIGADNAFAFDISAACSGFVYALSIGQKYIASGSYNKIMVIGGEVMSKHLDFTDRSTCILFGDGGGGVIIESTETNKIFLEKMHSNGKLAKSLTANYMPTNNISSNVANGELAKFLHMDGRAIYSFATRQVPKNINEVLELGNLKITDVKYAVPHQANQRIVEVVSKKMGIPASFFYSNIHKYGNTSSGSIPIALAEMNEKKPFEDGDKIMLTGFGAGLTWGTIILEF